MTGDEVEYLERLFAAYEHEPGPLSDWEKSFMRDQQERWERYAESMRLSDKQWAILRRIGSKVYDLAEPDVEAGK